MDYAIRKAVLGDLSDITLIYNQGIEDGIATLETDLRDEEERKTWFLSRSPRHQVLVITDETNAVLGWASLNVFNTRVCFEGVADVSIYIRRDLRGRGLGKRLLDSLSEEARKQGFHKLVLAALNENEYGKKLYHFIGFREVGVYLKHGFRNGRWVDVVVMEKFLY